MWIQSHSSLRYHVKLTRLMRDLRLNRRECIGLLHMLWWYAIDYSHDGVLTESPAELARVLEWRRRPEDLVSTLVASGFLDRVSPTSVRIHNAETHFLFADGARAKAEENREKTRNRVKAFRDKRRSTLQRDGVTTPVTQCNTPDSTGLTDLKDGTEGTGQKGVQGEEGKGKPSKEEQATRELVAERLRRLRGYNFINDITDELFDKIVLRFEEYGSNDLTVIDRALLEFEADENSNGSH